MILLIAGGVYYFTKSEPPSSESSVLAGTVLTLKQDIVALKSQEANVAARAWPAYQVGLTAELKGDGEFALKNFEAARQSYLEAIFNFKKALETPQETIPEKSPAETPRAKTVANNGNEEAIRAQARRVYAKVISEERIRLAREEKAAPPADAAPVSVASDSLAILRNQAAAAKAAVAKAAMAAAKTKLDAEVQGELLFQEAEKIEIRAGVAFAENNFEQSGRLYKLAEEQYEGVAQQIARAQQREKERSESVRREALKLISSYEAAFARRSVSGLKALFESGFSADDEKAWAKFFASVQDLKAGIAGESVQINGNNVEAGFTVRIDYANHKGIKQSPMTFQERWTLAEKNGKWVVVSRQVR